jgi:Fe-S-cluster containining protein
LNFTCIPGCTACCRQPGWVYLTEEDLVRAAAHLGMTPAEFETRHVYRTAHKLRFRKPRGSQCPFLEETGCAIHPNKPEQCRTFPFWPEILDDPEEASYCPGIS